MLCSLLETSNKIKDVATFLQDTVEMFATDGISIGLNVIRAILDEISKVLTSKEMIELLEGKYCLNFQGINIINCSSEEISKLNKGRQLRS